MTLSSRHRIRNSSPVGLRPSTLSLWRRLPTILSFTCGWGRNIFVFFKHAETGNQTPKSSVKGSGANHYPKAPLMIMRTIASTKFLNPCNVDALTVTLPLHLLLWFLNSAKKISALIPGDAYNTFMRTLTAFTSQRFQGWSFIQIFYIS